jgi:ABC-type multidrug transport system ATPase subunit
VPAGPLDIEFAGVSFGYMDGRPVLDNLNWRIEAGSLVALVGPTGAGKTTALALVPRLYDVWAGEVRVGGLDVRQLGVADLRSKVTLLLQESLLFRDTIWNNIAYGRPGADPDDVIAAAAAAGVLSFADGLENGLQTMISERGSTLSGGQKQCVALARAMLREAPVVIMDEPTSSLDAVTEELVIRGIAKLIAGRTAIVIAHRFSTIRGADMVAVMEAGKLVEIGSPDKLLDDKGLFAKLSRIQGMPANTTTSTDDAAHRLPVVAGTSFYHPHMPADDLSDLQDALKARGIKAIRSTALLDGYASISMSTYSVQEFLTALAPGPVGGDDKLSMRILGRRQELTAYDDPWQFEAKPTIRKNAGIELWIDVSLPDSDLVEVVGRLRAKPQT